MDDGKTKADVSYTRATVQRKTPGGSPLSPRRVTETSTVKDAAFPYAVGPGPRDFGLSPNGKIQVDEKAVTTLAEDPQGKHNYLTVDDAQIARIKEAIIDLASEPLRPLRLGGKIR